MRSKKGDHILNFGFFFILLSLFAFLIVGFTPSIVEAGQADAEVIDFPAFHKALEIQDDSEALSTGNRIFAQLERQYKGDTGFRAYKSKLDAAQFLAEQMQQQLKKAINMRILSVADELFKKNTTAGRNQLSVAPAKSFYETSVRLFSEPVKIDGLTDEEMSFLGQYYNVKLRVLTSTIAKAGQALAIAEPSFKGTHNYVLVLPLLHISDKKSINIEVFPKWMRGPEQLDIFVDSCLLHFGFPFHAMSLAQKSAQLQNSSFSIPDFYISAAKKCGTSRPHIAADCLHRAIDYVTDKEPDKAVALRFEVVQLWLDSGNYPLAAGQAHKIFETYPNHKESGKAIWLYYHALSRSNNINEILADINRALDDSRCKEYQARLMYIKWWALRRTRNQVARVAALEYEILKQYDNDPMVAPVLLSRATDFLAGQNYTDAYELLTKLVQKFPSTGAAIQAKKILVKLKAVNEVE